MTKEIRSFLFHSRVQLNFEKLILLGFIRIVLGIIAVLFVLGTEVSHPLKGGFRM